MKKQTITFLTSAVLLFFVIGCKKDKDDPEPEPEPTKTEHITESSWQFEKATANGTDVTAAITACWKDNTAIFVSTAEGTGTGTISEGANVCPTSSAGAFTWNFQTNETILFMSTPIIPTGSGSFTIVALNEVNLVVSQDMVLPVLGMQNVVFTFKH